MKDHTPLTLNKVTLDTASRRFLNLLRSKAEANGDKLDEQFEKAAKEAVDFCKKRFSQEFAKYGGHYTSHGPDHAARVLHYAMQLQSHLTEDSTLDELFALGIAAILHDVGMTEPIPHIDGQTEEQCSEIRRKNHGKFAAEIIKKCSGPELPVIREANTDIYDNYLPYICAAHCTSGFESNIKIISEKQREDFGHNRFSLMAGILLLADELDITYHRAESDTKLYQSFRTNVTKAHWWKCWLVADVQVNPGSILIAHASDKCVPYASEYRDWTIAKLNEQLKMLRERLDPTNLEPFWNLHVICTDKSEKWWRVELPLLDTSVVEAAQMERIRIPGQREMRLIERTRLIWNVESRGRHWASSNFFDEVVLPRISGFRGQGAHLQSGQAKLSYIELDHNIALLESGIKCLTTHLRDGGSGVNFYIYTGEIGVGKTHLLSVFLERLRSEHPEMADKAILVRAELSECGAGDFEAVKKKVAKEVFIVIEKMGLVDPIRAIMRETYSPGVSPQVPKALTEINSWKEKRIMGFLQTIGEICKGDGTINVMLKDKAPGKLVIFLDNSDHLDPSLVTEIYDWVNNLSGSAGVVIWLCLRPETYNLYWRKTSKERYSRRIGQPVTSPPLEQVIARRLELFLNDFQSEEEIRLPFGSTTVCLSANDARDAIQHVADLALENGSGLLPALVGKAERDHQPNIRAGLEAFIRVLASHVITDEVFAEAVIRAKSIDPALGMDHRSSSAGWPKVLEAIILGGNAWYSSGNGVVENLFNPPEMKHLSDYFLTLHCLQVLEKSRDSVRFEKLCELLDPLGHSLEKIECVIRRLVGRTELIDGELGEVDNFTTPTFPLVVLEGGAGDLPYTNQAALRITSWGSYHIRKLIFQAQYWKHMFYDMYLPASLARELRVEAVHGARSELLCQLIHVFEFLGRIEVSTIGGTLDKMSKVGIEPVMKRISIEVCSQLGEQFAEKAEGRDTTNSTGPKKSG